MHLSLLCCADIVLYLMKRKYSGLQQYQPCQLNAHSDRNREVWSISPGSLIESSLSDVYKELLMNLCSILIDHKVTFLLIIFFAKILYVTPVQDIHVHIPVYQVNWSFEVDANNLSAKTQVFLIWLSDVINITSLTLAIVCLF